MRVGVPSAVRSVSVQRNDRSSSDYIVSWQAPYSGGMTIRSYMIRYRQVPYLGLYHLTMPAAEIKQESCAMAKMTVQCAL